MLYLEKNSLDQFKSKLKLENWNDVSEVHFVHGFLEQIYADTFYFTKYPNEEQVDEIKKHCIISSFPKKDIAEYANENEINTMVIGTRERQGIEGLFSSSFAEYMLRHAASELKVLRVK